MRKHFDQITLFFMSELWLWSKYIYMCVCVLQAHLSWCWQRAPAYLWPLSKPTATATRRLQDTVSQQLSQALATACKDPTPFSPHAGWSYHPSISHSPSPDTRPLLSHSALYREQEIMQTNLLSPFCFFNPPTLFKLSWRTQFYFCCQRIRFHHKGWFSHIPYRLD